jgi:opacity protein-like surface antigen
MRIHERAICVLCVALFPALGQRISFGVIAGTNISNHFPPDIYSYAGDPINPPILAKRLSGPRSFLFGGVLQARINEALSLDLNVLHRPMKMTEDYREYLSTGDIVYKNEWTAVRAWQFPILLKYNLSRAWFSGAVRPFVEAGPSVRTQEDAGSAEPSRFGFTTGAGVSYQWRRLRIAPSLRYTRWQRETSDGRQHTRPDQLELLTSVTYDTYFNPGRTGERRFLLGALGGFGLNHEFARWPDGAQHPERTRFLVGVSAELRLARGFSVEADGIYKPLRQGENGQDSSRLTVLTWQIPLLAKYRLGARNGWTPFVEGGPSFRLSGNLNGYRPSPLGITVGGGVETRLGGLRLAPAFRYTRWQRDSKAYSWSPGTNPNSVELVIGLSF